MIKCIRYKKPTANFILKSESLKAFILRSIIVDNSASLDKKTVTLENKKNMSHSHSWDFREEQSAKAFSIHCSRGLVGTLLLQTSACSVHSIFELGVFVADPAFLVCP